MKFIKKFNPFRTPKKLTEDEVEEIFDSVEIFCDRFNMTQKNEDDIGISDIKIPNNKPVKWYYKHITFIGDDYVITFKCNNLEMIFISIMSRNWADGDENLTNTLIKRLRMQLKDIRDIDISLDNESSIKEIIIKRI